MTEAHVISTLRARRLGLAQHIADTEKKLAKLRAAAANIDAAIDLLTFFILSRLPGGR